MNKKHPKIMLLGSGELGKEFTLAAQRLGLYVIAVDRYALAPAMVVADAYEVIDMLQPEELEKVFQKHQPDIVVPEIEALRTEKLLQWENQGAQVIPSAKAAHLTMNRDAIRDVAARKLKLKTAQYAYAESWEELDKISPRIGFPQVVKPVMSSSGKGQSIVKSKLAVKKAWDYAVANMRGDKKKIIVEEFIRFESEITLLTIKQKKGPTLFVNPIGHRQERGDYQESWMPARITKKQLVKAQKMAKKVTDELGGSGLFGVEFFLTKDDVYFSELSPRPHDTGLVTLISQNFSEFELHLRAVLGLPIPRIDYWGPSASAVILGSSELRSEIKQFSFSGLQKALTVPSSEVRLFGKPLLRPYRRMGVALARAKNTDQARILAKKVARHVRIHIE